MKFSAILPLALVLNQSAAFAPQRAFVRPSVATFMSEEEPEAAPAPAPAPEHAGADLGSKMVWTISGCQDHQESADDSINGQRQGAMSAALIATLEETDGNITYNELLHKMRARLAGRYEQVPSISTTHAANYNVKFMG
mmetsp:Transcript_129527/g.192837  ORF Transcript_129527/g.192837 Transcript_129527/m.192837 type:complete len:139 (+) Transcript_129527:78-494(+)